MRRMYSKPQLLEAVEQEAEVNGLKAFENIVDKDGHKRFIEGDITFKTITGLTQKYAKWALSGSHLLIVLCGTFADSTVFASQVIAEIDLPSWIKDKISIIAGEIVDYKQVSMFASDLSTQQISTSLQKTSANVIRVFGAGLTLTKERTFRIAFDLLIDNE